MNGDIPLIVIGFKTVTCYLAGSSPTSLLAQR